MSRRLLLRGQHGFTLAEMLVVTAVLGVVFAGVLVGLQAGVASSRMGNGRVEAQSAARIGLDRIMRDIRSAGVNPTGNAFLAAGGACPCPVVSTALASQMVLNSDLDASGGAVAPGGGACDPAADSEVVQYSVSSNALVRSTNPNIGSCGAAMIGGVQSLSFQYLDSAGTAIVGNVPATNMNITTVVVTLTVAAEQVTGSQTGTMVVTMTDEARIRNR